MYTRSQYLNGEVSHGEYYRQFINESVMSLVKTTFSSEELRKAFKQDEHFNTIPFSQWDMLSVTLMYYIFYGVSEKVKECGDYLTLSGSVCILKEAARQIVEEEEEEEAN